MQRNRNPFIDNPEYLDQISSFGVPVTPLPKEQKAVKKTILKPKEVGKKVGTAVGKAVGKTAGRGVAGKSVAAKKRVVPKKKTAPRTKKTAGVVGKKCTCKKIVPNKR